MVGSRQILLITFLIINTGHVLGYNIHKRVHFSRFTHANVAYITKT